jgi:tetratricopeptide (TPR) repeat protein
MTWKRLPALALTVGLMLSTVTPSAYCSQATDQLLIKARSLEGRGLLELASRSWEQVLLADPNNVEALAGLARYAQASGKQADAARYLDRLRRINPSNPEIARIESIKPLTGQRELLEEAQRLSRKQDFEGALRNYRQVFGNEPPAGGWAIAYFETEAAAPGGWDDAIAGLEKYIKKYPESPEYSLALGKLLTYHQRTRVQGLQVLEAIKGDPSIVEKAHLAWRQALLWDAGSAASMPSLHAYLERYPDTELAKLTNRGAKPAGGAQSAQAVQSPREGEGYQALHASKLKEAADDFSAALRTAPRSASALAGLGFVRLKQQDFAGAIPLFEQAIALQPKDKSVAQALSTAKFWSHMKKGGEYLNASRTSDAVQEFKLALDLRPQSTDAARALAGSYEQQQQPALAVPLYRRLAQAKPEDSENWLALMKSLYEAKDFTECAAVTKQMPSGVRTQLLSRPDFQIMAASISAQTGDAAEARRLLNLAERSMTAEGGQPSPALQKGLADLYLRMSEPHRAAEVFERLTSARPRDIDAWQGLVTALARAGELDRGSAAIQRMPAETYKLAVTKPDFLRAAANLESGAQRFDIAERLLERAAAIDKSNGKQPDAGNQLQLSDVLVHSGKPKEAEQVLRDAVDEAPDMPAARLALLSLLHAQKRDRDAFDQMQRIPEAVFAALQEDPGFVSLEAGIYSNLGRKDEALKIIKGAVVRFDRERRPAPVDLRIQEAWLLVNQHGEERELYGILAHYSDSPELTSAQKSELGSIWSIWARRQAADATDRGDLPQAISILRAASQLLPADATVQGSLAGAYLGSRDPKSAFAVYKKWGLRNATADDFSGAVGAALSVNDNKLAVLWLNRGLQKYPRDSRLLSLAGKQAAERGDYDKAKLYLREALATLPPDQGGDGTAQGTAGSSTASAALLPKTANTANFEQTLGALLLPGVDLAEYRQTAQIRSFQPNRLESDMGMPVADGVSVNPAGNDGFDLNRQQPSNETRLVQTANDSLTVDNSQDSNAAISLPSLGQTARVIDQTQNGNKTDSNGSSLHDDIVNDLESIDGRNSPYFENGVSVHARSGRGGVDKLTIEQADIAASTTVGNQVRLSLIAHPTYVDSGNPDTPTTPGFGSTLANGYSTSPTAFGIAAEGQLSTRDFGLRLGLTPYNFLVHNWLGGLRLTPRGGPFTILVSRDAILDTKLSFAGERDAGTSLIWGGVMANSASVLGHWGTDKSGFYASAGYQNITGKGVESNSQINVTTGTYFKLFSSSQGSLTAGLNLSGMHYDKNLRYFTLGQGGYFSPQQYFLANIPLRWEGTWNRKLQYSVAGSLGVQHFSEDQSAFFPLLVQNAFYYPAFASTGGNYNFDFRIAYQLAPQWLAGAFADAGNARDYRNVAAGLYLKYVFEPRPFSSEINADSVPDWKGSQPFGLPPTN